LTLTCRAIRRDPSAKICSRRHTLLGRSRRRADPGRTCRL